MTFITYSNIMISMILINIIILDFDDVTELRTITKEE